MNVFLFILPPKKHFFYVFTAKAFSTPNVGLSLDSAWLGVKICIPRTKISTLTDV